MPQEDSDLWVFGYGSLIWRPGFEFLERLQGVAHGYHRSLCVYSHVHRGTPDRPGLVLGMMRGGACRGVVYRVSHSRKEEAVRYLRERELVTDVYKETKIRVRLHDGCEVRAIAYVVDTRHPQFAGRLDRSETLRLVREGVGRSGPNPQYVTATARHLSELGIIDVELEWLSKQLESRSF